MIPASAPKITNRMPATFRLALQSMGFNVFRSLSSQSEPKNIAVGGALATAAP